MGMKTLQEIKEEVAISKGFLSWNNFLKNEPIWENINKSYDEAAELYASQFKQGWISVSEGMAKNVANKLRTRNGKFVLCLFDNGDTSLFNEDFPRAILTHIYFIPNPPTK